MLSVIHGGRTVMLQNIEFDQAILTDIANQPVQVPESILAHATVLSEGVAALKLRKKIHA